MHRLIAARATHHVRCPAVAMAAATTAPAATGTIRRSGLDTDPVLELGELLGSDPVNLLQFVDAGESSMLLTPSENALRHDRAHPVDGLQLLHGGRVEVNLLT